MPATNQRFLPTGATFRVGSASEIQWLQLVLVPTVHRLARTNMCGWTISCRRHSSSFALQPAVVMVAASSVGHSGSRVLEVIEWWWCGTCMNGDNVIYIYTYLAPTYSLGHLSHSFNVISLSLFLQCGCSGWGYLPTTIITFKNFF